MKRGASIFRVIMLGIFVLCAANGYAGITIDSTIATPSRCINDGTITVYGQSSTPMIYAIISGPDIRIPQSGSQFGGLAPGSYQVLITNFSNDTARASAVVGGNYTFPDFTPTYKDPFCPGTASGMIVGNALGSVKTPYHWVLTNVSTSASITQASDSFYNLTAGSYTLRLFDSCQSFATRSVMLTDPDHSFTIGNINNELYSCDTAQLFVQMNLPSGNYAPPYTIQVQTHNGTWQHILNNISFSGWYPEFRERVAGVSYGDYVNITVTDACGYSQSKSDVIAPFNIQVNFAGRTDTCQATFAAYFSVTGYAGQQNVWPTYMASPVTIVTSDAATGVQIDSSVTYGDTLRNSLFLAYTPYLTNGHIYHIRLTDGCGNTFTNDYQWPVLTQPSQSEFSLQYGCLDSTAAYEIFWSNRFYTLPTFELLSGPASIHSTKPHYAYSDTIIYPQSYIVPMAGSSGAGSFTHIIELENLAPGTYHYRISDSCGHTLTDSFTIYPQDLIDLHYELSFTRGCPGENTASINLGNTNILSSAFFTDAQSLNVNLFNSPDTIRNLDAGNYFLRLQYYNPVGITVNQNPNCWIMNDTIVIPAYTLPQVSYATQVKCNGTVNVGLQPDSARGIAPYKYEILTGPQTAAVQPSNFFTLTQPGSYVARISDACGFAQTFTFTVDTLSFQQIVESGSSCVGNSAMLINQHSPYATYTWRRPDGTFYTGDTLRIDPVLSTDYGVYHVLKYVSVNGCRDTFSVTYTLGSSTTTNSFATICSGRSVVFAGHTYTQAGTYYDTIHTVLCDSVVILHLAVGSVIYDSVSQNICPGQSVTVGTHIYNATGIYRDTFATAGCDSIHILNLQVGVAGYDSVSQNICSGQSVAVGIHIYNATGIYRDTFATAGCDSIHVLNLQVGSTKRDSASQNICTGQSITIGSHIYNTTGIYRDTFATTGCDSIHILNLQVGSIKYDSVSQSICPGQSITVGTHMYNTTGIYRDTFATAGCDSVHILNLQVASVKYDSVSISICAGQSIVVGAHTYSTAGIYLDTLSTASGCDSIYVLNLSVLEAIRDTIDLGFCEGESIAIAGVTYTQAGIYTDTFATSSCDSMRSFRITTLANPNVHIVASRTDISPGDTVQLNISGNGTLAYHWSSDATLSNTNVRNPMAIVDQSMWIAVEGVDGNNCRAIDSVFIRTGDCEGTVYVPNAFTPNGDGINDGFRIFGKCIRLNSLKIFNRWGEKIWETSDINQTWDGSYQGAQQPTEVYVYIVNYSLLPDKSGTTKQMQGSITLIR